MIVKSNSQSKVFIGKVIVALLGLSVDVTEQFQTIGMHSISIKISTFVREHPPTTLLQIERFYNLKLTEVLIRKSSLFQLFLEDTNQSIQRTH